MAGGQASIAFARPAALSPDEQQRNLG